MTNPVGKATRDRTALHRAARSGDHGEVQARLAEGYDINARDFEGFTPVLHAARSHRCNLAMVRTLVVEGADVNDRTEFGGHTPLHLLMSHSLPEDPKKLQAVEYLLGKKADPNIENSVGMIPLVSFMKSMISLYGEKEGLMFFAKTKDMDRVFSVIRMMVDAGSDLSIKDEQGDHARDLVHSFARMIPARLADSRKKFLEIATPEPEAEDAMEMNACLSTGA